MLSTRHEWSFNLAANKKWPYGMTLRPFSGVNGQWSKVKIPAICPLLTCQTAAWFFIPPRVTRELQTYSGVERTVRKPVPLCWRNNIYGGYCFSWQGACSTSLHSNDDRIFRGIARYFFPDVHWSKYGRARRWVWEPPRRYSRKHEANVDEHECERPQNVVITISPSKMYWTAII